MPDRVPEAIEKIFAYDHNANLSAHPCERGIRIEYGAMYERPDADIWKMAGELKQLYDADDVLVDEHSISGCESCDWGSDYGWDLVVVNPKANLDMIGNWYKA